MIDPKPDDHDPPRRDTPPRTIEELPWVPFDPQRADFAHMDIPGAGIPLILVTKSDGSSFCEYSPQCADDGPHRGESVDLSGARIGSPVLTHDKGTGHWDITGRVTEILEGSESPTTDHSPH
jgi:hypothetical protein